MSIQEITKKYSADRKDAIVDIAHGNYVCLSKASLDDLSREMWNAGAADIKLRIAEHIKTLPLESEFAQKLIAQVHATGGYYSSY